MIYRSKVTLVRKTPPCIAIRVPWDALTLYAHQAWYGSAVLQHFAPGNFITDALKGARRQIRWQKVEEEDAVTYEGDNVMRDGARISGGRTSDGCWLSE